MSTLPAVPHRILTLDLGLALCSLFWLVFLATAPVPPGVAFGGTLGLLVVDLGVGLAILVEHKRVAVVLALPQLGLFAALHALIYSDMGMRQYACVHPPEAHDWVQFTAIHVLRATDVLDVLYEYGIDLQTVKHTGIVPGLLLLVMHLAVDVFVLALLLRWGLWLLRWLAERRTRAPLADRKAAAERLARWLALAARLGLVACVLLVAWSAFTQGWPAWDWLLWPLDAILRGVDVGDAMQIFEWQLHGVVSSSWLATLAVLLRLFVGLFIAEWLTYAHLRLLGGWSLFTLEELTESLADPNAEVRRAAAESLAKLGPVAVEARHALVAALADPSEEVRQAVATALQQMVVPALVQQLDSHAPEARQAAACALGEIGPLAAAAVPALTQTLAAQVRTRQLSPEDQLGVADLATAQSLAEDNARIVQLAMHRAAVVALGRIGPGAYPAILALVLARVHKDADVRQDADVALAAINGNWPRSPAAVAAVPALIQALTHKEPPSLRERSVLSLPEFGLSETDKVRCAAAETLGRIGPAARAAIPALRAAAKECAKEVIVTHVIVTHGVKVVEHQSLAKVALAALAKIDPLPPVVFTFMKPP